MTSDNDNASAAPASVQDSKSNARIQVEVSAGLVFRNGLLLITQRRPEDHLGGLWEFPGGKRLPQESFEACLRRELMEELGIEVEVQELLDAVTHQYPEKLVHLKFFRCGWVKKEPQTHGCHDFAWVGKNQLANYAFPAADQKVLQKLLNSAEFWR
jgi:mutator protein MutT